MTRRARRGTGAARRRRPARRAARPARWASQLGQATVELALLLPVVLLLALSALQVGAIARDLILVHHAAREAGRAAAVDPDPAAARQAALGSTGLDPHRLSVRLRRPAQSGSRATVVVSYRSPIRVPLLGQALADVTVTTTVRVRVE